MKVCRECKQEKPLTDFYKHAKMADRHLNKCIECVKDRVSKHRDANLEKVREYDRKRGSLPHRVQARKEYVKTDAGKQARKRGSANYRERYPMKYAAHIVARNAIRDGKLIPAASCEVCNSNEKIEGHHDDYTKPLDLRWLCEKCHKAWHRINEPIYK